MLEARHSGGIDLVYAVRFDRGTDTCTPFGKANVIGLRPETMAIRDIARSITSLSCLLKPETVARSSMFASSPSRNADFATFRTAPMTAFTRRIVNGRILVTSPSLESLKSRILRTSLTSFGS